MLIEADHLSSHLGPAEFLRGQANGILRHRVQGEGIAFDKESQSLRYRFGSSGHDHARFILLYVAAEVGFGCDENRPAGRQGLEGSEGETFPSRRVDECTAC